MAHRPGHNEDLGEECCSMDRRKYLSTLAAGAAFGAVAVGVAACGGGGSESTTTGDTTTTPADTSKAGARSLNPAANPIDVKGKNLWGYLRVFPARITTIAEAKESDLLTEPTLRIPYFNNTGLDVTANPVFGFTLLKIGCPGEFAIAINLTMDDDPASHPSDPEITRARNRDMDNTLENVMKYRRLPWKGMNVDVCPPPAEQQKK